MAIPNTIIEDIKRRNDIENIIGSYVNLKRAGTTSKGLCPFHNEKTPSFTVYSDTQSFYCFGCGAAGDVVTFIMKMENLDYMSAIDTLAQRVGIDISQYDSSQVKTGQQSIPRQKILQMNLEAAKFYRDILFDKEKGEEGRKYLSDRKLSNLIVKRFGLGFAPKYGNPLLKHLSDLGYTRKEMLAASLIGHSTEKDTYYDFFRNRIMFPIIDVTGNIVGFSGRTIEKEHDGRKYVNSSDTPAFKKTKNLFALNYAKNTKSGYFILCEGQMDVISLHESGFENAVACLGTALTDQHANIIKKYVSKVILSYDSDAAGQKATQKAIPILESVGIDVSILSYSGAKDPDEFIKKFGAEEFKRRIESSQGTFEYKLSSLKEKYPEFEKDTQEKVNLIDELCKYISTIKSSVERELYISHTADEFKLSKASIKNDVESYIRKEKYLNQKKQNEKILSDTLGISDNVNKDFARNPKAARCEESIIGMILLHNNLIEHTTDGIKLSEDDFITELGKRYYRFISENYIDGVFNITSLNSEFSFDEVSRAFTLLEKRRILTNNSDEVFDEYVRSIRNNKTKNMSLEDLIKSKKR